MKKRMNILFFGLLFVTAMVYANGEGEDLAGDVDVALLLEMEGKFYQLAYDVSTNRDNAYGSPDSILRAYGELLDSLDALPPDSAEFFYLNAIIRKEISNSIANDDADAARTYYYEALESAGQAAAFNLAYANVYALLASLKGSISRYEGFLSILGALSSIEKLNKQAFSLDENNPMAWENLGTGYLFSPAGFGRNISRAIIAFETQIEYGNEYQQFWGRIWLSVTLFEQGEKAAALNMLRELRAQAPDSPVLQFVEEAIRNNTNPFTG